MTYRAQALANAKRHLGVRESPPNSNRGPEVTKWLRRAGINTPAPWCMAFIWCMFDDAGLRLEYPNKASVGFFEDWGRKNGYLVTDPRPGDVVCYRFDRDNWPDHVGIIDKVYPTYLDVIEGNTAVGNDANGGMVMRRRRNKTRCKFVRVAGAPRKPITVRKPPVIVTDDVEKTIAVLKQTPAYKRGWRRMVELVRHYESMRKR